MTSFAAIIFAVVVLGALAGVAFSNRGWNASESLATESAPPSRLSTLLERLKSSSNPDSFLIVADPETNDFVQFSASAGAIEIDFPLVTPRQQALESRVRGILEANNLKPRISTGADGSRFLDADSTRSPEETAEIVRAIFRDAFGRLPSQLQYQSEGLETHAG